MERTPSTTKWAGAQGSTQSCQMTGSLSGVMYPTLIVAMSTNMPTVPKGKSTVINPSSIAMMPKRLARPARLASASACICRICSSVAPWAFACWSFCCNVCWAWAC